MRRKERQRQKLRSVKAAIGELKGSRQSNRAGKGPRIKLPKNSKKKLKKYRKKKRRLSERIHGVK